ncbi:MAG: lipoyl synthase [Bacteroidetes bacterium]|nr:lipoyl synthase [Bacteroidota bacterium]
MTQNFELRKRKKPSWMKVQLPNGKTYIQLKKLVEQNNLATICQSGNCPNMGECWNAGTATFMILGINCSRNCTFCDVKPGKPLPPDPLEPARVAQAIKLMGLKHSVITSVTRDDLEDHGAEFWAETIREIKIQNPGTTMEVLIPDMKDDLKALQKIVNEKPEIISHNMETIKRLYKEVRPQANYNRSLRQIKATKEAGGRTKSGLMLGLGETGTEVIELLHHLKKNQCDIVTIGQYLPPSSSHYPLSEFIHPDKFQYFKEYGIKIGFEKVESSPLVRSSYHSEQQI